MLGGAKEEAVSVWIAGVELLSYAAGVGEQRQACCPYRHRDNGTKGAQAPTEARKGFAGSRGALASEGWRGASGPSVCGLCPITPAPPTRSPLGSLLIRLTSLFNKKYMNK